MNLLFAALSDLTGGLVSDITTAIIALIGISFLVMAFEYLCHLLGMTIADSQAQRREASDYEEYSSRRERSEKFAATYSAEHDFVGPEPSRSNKNSSSQGYF